MKKIEYILVGQTDKATTFFEELAAKVNELVDVHNESVEKKCTDYACYMSYGKWTHYCGKKENETCQPTTPEKKCCEKCQRMGRRNETPTVYDVPLPCTSSCPCHQEESEKRNDVY